jgi:hypothetical protein
MPFEIAQETGPITNLKKNQAFTVTLPLRGALPMRVEDITPDRIVCATLEGHPLAGLLTFDFLERGPQVRFEVGVHARGADLVDAVLIATIGELLQDANWLAVVERVVKLSGGRAPAGAQMLITTLDDEEAEKVEKWASDLVVRRLRGRVPPGPAIDGRRRAVRVPVKPAAPARKRKTAKKKAAKKRPTTKKKATTRPAAARKTAKKSGATAAASPRPRSRPAARGSRR